jgi:hypothetical protein
MPGAHVMASGTPALAPRSAEQVFESHLRYRAQGDLDLDLIQNYARDVVLFCEFGVLHGHDAIRKSAQRLCLQLSGGRFEYRVLHVEGEYAFLKWQAESDSTRIEDGADSFVIREGLIVMQTVSYRIVEKTGN